MRDYRDTISLFKERNRNVREFYFLTFGHLNIRKKKFSLLLLYLYLYQTETKINKFLLATRRKKWQCCLTLKIKSFPCHRRLKIQARFFLQIGTLKTFSRVGITPLFYIVLFFSWRKLNRYTTKQRLCFDQYWRNQITCLGNQTTQTQR